jgi:hypothetical protein
MGFVHICWQPCCPALDSGIRPEALRPALSSGLPFSTNNKYYSSRRRKNLENRSCSAPPKWKPRSGALDVAGSAKCQRAISSAPFVWALHSVAAALITRCRFVLSVQLSRYERRQLCISPTRPSAPSNFRRRRRLFIRRAAGLFILFSRLWMSFLDLNSKISYESS